MSPGLAAGRAGREQDNSAIVAQYDVPIHLAR
jgi:hypothetical protein